jgi:hypothetical protein
MRTTLELDDDLLAEARQLAKERGVSIGQIISDLARQSLASKAPIEMRNGIPLISRHPDAPPADMELVNRLRDEE